MLPVRARRVLWLDSAAGALAGVFILVLSTLLSEFYGLSLGLVRFIGIANALYASYSGTLAVAASRGRIPSAFRVNVLIAANAAWTLVCMALAVATNESATPFGTAHLILEGVFVGGLAVTEYKRVRPLV